jgi:baseplate J-like protein
MIYVCCDERRRNAARESALNGIDYLEVLDAEAPPNERQRLLSVHFVNDQHLVPLKAANFRIEGGERITNVQVQSVSTAGNPPNVLTLKLDKWGDFSSYTLRLVQDPQEPEPPAGFDRILSTLKFSFKVECPTDFDCRQDRGCPPEAEREPDIDYLAKDYASFRRLILDRLAVLAPQWKERNAADLGMALVELLAYDADSLSYRQDAVMTEAYFETARRRVSVRRHSRLVDYFMHDGCNARAWVQISVNANNVVIEKGTQLLTRIPTRPPRIAPDASPLTGVSGSGNAPVVFETMHQATLQAGNNTMHFYTWGDDRCCLPTGATHATLKLKSEDGTADLRAGDVLILMEQVNPQNGNEEEADPSHRHAVRLTRVAKSTDPLFKDPDDDTQDIAIIDIEWADEDALPFPLCLWDVFSEADRKGKLPVSIALGNIVLVDHGHSVKEASIADGKLNAVPQPRLFNLPPPSGHLCEREPRAPIPPRFGPSLKFRPLTNAATFDHAASAAAAMAWSMRDVQPVVRLESASSRGKVPWSPKRDLLNSGPDKTEFVVETESDYTSFIRFGDDRHGKRPQPGTSFAAFYRVGNGIAGNVGAEAIMHIISADSGITGVRNPLPATGGSDAETIKDVRRRAPYAFRTQERAVTEADYAEVSERHPGVQRAAATFRWTGSWHTVFVNIDRLGGLKLDELFEQKIRRHLERFRMAGHDLEIDRPRYVPLELEMQVCVHPEYFRSQVKAALAELFSNRLLNNGRPGLFHPDNFTFGQPVYLSPIYAAAQDVPGVTSVQITKFQRLRIPDPKPLQDGKLIVGRLEIAQLDNDPNFPEHGVFRLTLGGGK